MDQLDAKEDISCHGKLVQFYEHLGGRVKSSNKMQYFNDNDSETYRKVPMQIDLHPARADSPSKQERARLRCKTFSHLLSSKGSFLPVQLVCSFGKLSVRPFASREELKFDWLITESAEGIQLTTTLGHILLATPDGTVSVLSPDQLDEDISDLEIDASELRKWTNFVPCHASDQDSSEHDNPSPQGSRSRSLWVLHTCHGLFLTADSLRHMLSYTRLPSFW